MTIIPNAPEPQVSLTPAADFGWRKKLVLILNRLISTAPKGGVGITIDGGGSTVTTGDKGYTVVPYDAEIQRWSIVADRTGSCVVDVWKSTYSGFPLSAANSICGNSKPTLTSAQKSQGTSLSGWTTTISAGDIIGFNVDSVSTVQRVNLLLWVVRV